MESTFKSFITENEIEEKKRIKQKIWEQTRTADQPLEAPEEEYDPRTLYERLKEQKDKKQEEFDESKKLKHLIRGLDNDEITFLEMVDESKQKEEEEKHKEEQNAIDEFKKHLNKVEQEKNIVKTSTFSKEASSSNRTIGTRSSKRQADLLANAIKRKQINEQENNKKVKKDGDDNEDDKNKKNNQNNSIIFDNGDILKDGDNPSAFKVLGTLPGLSSYYSDSSDSLSQSSDASDTEVNSSEFNNFFLLSKTRQIKKYVKQMKKRI